MESVEANPSRMGGPTNAEIAAKRRARARIACDLLLAACYKHHPEHALAALSGIEPRVVDLEPPPHLETRIAVLSGAAELLVRPSISDIANQVAPFYGVSVQRMCSRTRVVDVCRARQVCMYLARKLTVKSYPQIAAALHLADHTTVMHGIRKIEGELKDNARLRDEIEVLEMRIKEELLNRPTVALGAAVRAASALRINPKGAPCSSQPTQTSTAP